MARCIHCGKESLLISSPLNVCVDCIRNNFDDVKFHIEKIHARVKMQFGLPPSPPRSDHGVTCTFCVNQCQIPSGGRGYCGTRVNKDGKLIGGRPSEGNLSWYYDPLPTNCVGDWVCPGGANCGYPEYSYSRGAESGYKNLAVFFLSCTFNCLFCQNWHYREYSTQKGRRGPDFIVDGVDKQTSCICYFGGDPTPHLPYAIKASRAAQEKRKGQILRICWETNGAMNPRLLKKAVELSLQSGGNVKFDLKAWDEGLHYALCGVSNQWTLSNFRHLAELTVQRPDPPFLVASTLLVPGYVDEEEVSQIAKFIASLDPNIPYKLLAFYPQFYMQDLPTTSRKHAQRCLELANKAGLRRVTVGNIHLLRNSY
ncbi:MAG: radical SAM protein [Candidatus Aminicenantes bacterium]|nr:radical SAM protein [Candidatus Aminicenantes bacterium]MDH5383605.1 radical SAM protein [Candidatus Aminicenantes bacterium]